jgi:hypothetical protein
MKLFVILCLFVVAVYSAPTFDAQLDAPWILFKRTHEKGYSSTEEENNR